MAAIADSGNMAAARLAGGPGVHLVDSDDTSARLIVQSSRQSGMSVVCMDLLNFDDGEIYLRSASPSLTGKTYSQALTAFETATVIGLRRAGGVELNPPHGHADRRGRRRHRHRPGRLHDPARLAGGGHRRGRDRARGPRQAGTRTARWCSGGTAARARSCGISTVTWRRARCSTWRRDHPDAGGNLAGLRNLTLNVKDCETTDRFALESLGVGLYQHVIVLSDDRFEAHHADTRTLMSLLQLRDMQTVMHERYSIVSEMHDENNRELAEVTEADDIVISDTVIGLLLAQLAENRHLSEVFGYLFDSRGSEIYPRPASDYVTEGRPVTFATVIESARRRGETAIGYRRAARVSEPPHFGVVLNPAKSAELVFEAGDKVIVLAER